MVIQGCLAHLYGNTDYWWSILLRFFPGISIITIINSNRCFFLWIDDMMAYKRPLVNWARIPGYWWIDSWDSLCSLHLCLTTGTDCTEKGAPHVHFFSLPSFLNGRNIPSRFKKGSENETFLHIFTWLHVFHGWKKPAPSRHQLRWTTFWTWIFGPALGVSDGLGVRHVEATHGRCVPFLFRTHNIHKSNNWVCGCLR
jgi:hypothetical protein